MTSGVNATVPVLIAMAAQEGPKAASASFPFLAETCLLRSRRVHVNRSVHAAAPLAPTPVPPVPPPLAALAVLSPPVFSFPSPPRQKAGPMTQIDDMAAGMHLARSMLVSMASGDERSAVDAINTATEGEAKHALAQMLTIALEQARILGRNSRPPRTAEQLLRSAAEALNEDIIVTIAAQIVHDAERTL